MVPASRRPSPSYEPVRVSELYSYSRACDAKRPREKRFIAILGLIGQAMHGLRAQLSPRGGLLSADRVLWPLATQQRMQTAWTAGTSVCSPDDICSVLFSQSLPYDIYVVMRRDLDGC